MPLSPAYNPATSFANDETNQVAGRSTVRTVALDTEHANIASSINALKSNLELLQRDDGKLDDFLVEPYALSEQTRALITSRGTPRGLWAAGTLYAVGDVVQQASVAYICYTAHTSAAPFTANGFWIAISGDGSAAASAAAAAASQTAAATSATTATTQATAAAGSATAAATSATNSANSATASGNSATASAASAAAAATSEANAAASYDLFDDRFLGAKAANPTLDNDGNALVAGALFFDTTAGVMKVYTGSAWSAVSISSSGFIATLLDDADAAAARATLGATSTGSALFTAADAAAARTAAGFTSPVIDRAVGTYTTCADLTAQIPVDDTIPQNTEGTQIISVPFTMKSTTNRLRLRFRGAFALNAIGGGVAAIFTNVSANAVATTAQTSAAADYRNTFAIEHEFVPGTTSALTISVRVGPGSAITMAMNGRVGGFRDFGGTSAATLIVEEIAA